MILQKPKVFNLSLQRNGTKSFHRFCKDKGLKSLHWLPENPNNAQEFSAVHFDDVEKISQFCLENNTVDPLYDYYKNNFWNHYDSFSDFPIPLFYSQLMDQFPRSTFVLFYRDVTEWISSVRRHHAGSDANEFLDRLVYFLLTGVKKDRINDYTDAELRDAYNEYVKKVVLKNLESGNNLHLIYLDSDLATQTLNNIIQTPKTSVFGRYS